MDKMPYAYVAGKIRPLHYSVETMFAVNDKYGSIHEALELMSGDEKKAFDVVRFLAVQTVNDAELCRREAGYEPCEMITESMVERRMTPGVYLALKEAISKVIEFGYKQDVHDENEEIDLGLAELRKKEVAGT